MNASAPDEPRGPLGQLLAALRGLLATAISLGRTRLELLGVEVREELQRLVELLAWGAVAILAGAAGSLFVGLAVIFAFWETHRVLAAVLVTAAYFSLAAIALLLLRSRLRTRPLFLQATLGELARDEAEFRRPGQ